MRILNRSRLERHVTFCARGDLDITLRGSQAEYDTVQYLVDNLSKHHVGDYRILVNYSMPLRGRGSAGTLEIDLVIINRFGVFLVEVKDWLGSIDAYDDYWLQSGRYENGNAVVSVDSKARVLHTNWFARSGELRDLGRVSVVGLVVLARGKQHFRDHSNCGGRVVGPDPDLLGAIGINPLQFGRASRELSDEEILRIRDALYREHSERRESLVRGYRIVKELSPGEFFRAFEAVNVNVSALRVRIKQYQLDDISAASRRDVDRFTQSAKAVSSLGPHPNILQTFDFFPEQNRPDIFYEVTELPRGKRLDEIMSSSDCALSYGAQLDLIESVCQALDHAHTHGVYHRNLNPETVFVTHDGVVKLADFDFAKILGEDTIVRPGEKLVDNPMTAPEMFFNPSAACPATDVYSLGALWYFLANLPEQSSRLTLERLETMKMPPVAHGLMRSMLTEAVESRPQSTRDVLDQLRASKREVQLEH